MKVSSTDSGTMAYAAQLASLYSQRKTAATAPESQETPQQERSEPPAIQAAEGEKGGLINTYA